MTSTIYAYETVVSAICMVYRRWMVPAGDLVSVTSSTNLNTALAGATLLGRYAASGNPIGVPESGARSLANTYMPPV